jgi:putative addiction module component (TIGR02574 family)
MQVSARCESEVAGVTIDELMREALTLDPQGRAHLAHRLLDSLDELSEAVVEQLWRAEAARRDAEIDAGAPTYPVDEVLARARARRG